MKILFLGEQDWAGLGWHMAQAVNRHTEHEARQVCHWVQKNKFPVDVLVEKSGDYKAEISRWVEWADIVHLYLSGYWMLDGVAKPKRLIATHAQWFILQNPGGFKEKARQYGVLKEMKGAPWLQGEEELEFLPVATPVDEFSRYKRKRGGKPIVCTSPLSFRRKRTDEVRAVIGQPTDFEFRVIGEDVPWLECLKRKGEADLHVECFLPECGPGNSCREAWSMRIPVIAHCIEPTERAIRESYGFLPYYDAELQDWPAAIRRLLGDPALYKEYSDRGYDCVRRFHDYPVVARQFEAICREVVAAH